MYSGYTPCRWSHILINSGTPTAHLIRRVHVCVTSIGDTLDAHIREFEATPSTTPRMGVIRFTGSKLVNQQQEVDRRLLAISEGPVERSTGSNVARNAYKSAFKKMDILYLELSRLPNGSGNQTEWFLYTSNTHLSLHAWGMVMVCIDQTLRYLRVTLSFSWCEDDRHSTWQKITRMSFLIYSSSPLIQALCFTSWSMINPSCNS